MSLSLNNVITNNLIRLRAYLAVSVSQVLSVFSESHTAAVAWVNAGRSIARVVVVVRRREARVFAVWITGILWVERAVAGAAKALRAVLRVRWSLGIDVVVVPRCRPAELEVADNTWHHQCSQTQNLLESRNPWDAKIRLLTKLSTVCCQKLTQNERQEEQQLQLEELQNNQHRDEHLFDLVLSWKEMFWVHIAIGFLETHWKAVRACLLWHQVRRKSRQRISANTGRLQSAVPVSPARSHLIS